ncbi:MAG: hypothetical protein KF823_03505 [Xanthomonadales bacterium]|nr:hypothetical protein [Xanthomonadales bacterium]
MRPAPPESSVGTSRAAAPTALPLADPAGAGDADRLQGLMLAMDVVDTLRHQVDLAEHALSERERDAALVARIRSIYAGQGIEVSDAVIVEGVEALKRDRFVYRPPRPGPGQLLARMYVARDRAWPWLLAGGALLGLSWLLARLLTGLLP